ncbi:hypothetical protein NKH57_28585 [Mesorhizobium sp. M1050]|uniref:hypothetical protein n=1 Tax=unclassified Mesorhizobium TaxID=325217 RepID=UPI0033355D81
MSNAELYSMISKFISRTDVSIDIANAIESYIDDNFGEDEFMKETVEILARYRPGGGEFLFDTDFVSDRLSKTISYLDSKFSRK